MPFQLKIGGEYASYEYLSMYLFYLNMAETFFWFVVTTMFYWYH